MGHRTSAAPRQQSFCIHGEWAVKVYVTIDLENRYRGDADLLEACVRDGVLVFNLHVGSGARVANVLLCAMNDPRLGAADQEKADASHEG
jgi:hypothetical protein